MKQIHDIELADRLRLLAANLRNVIEFLQSEHADYGKDFMHPAISALWDRYLILRLHAIKVDPFHSHLNQGERAQKIKMEIVELSLSDKSEPTLRRWDALKTHNLTQKNYHSLIKKELLLDNSDSKI